MDHPPPGVPHPPGLHHPFDPANCLSDAMWMQQRQAEDAACHHARLAQEAEARSRDSMRQRDEALLLLLA